MGAESARSKRSRANTLEGISDDELSAFLEISGDSNKRVKADREIRRTGRTQVEGMDQLDATRRHVGDKKWRSDAKKELARREDAPAKEAAAARKKEEEDNILMRDRVMSARGMQSIVGGAQTGGASRLILGG